LESWSKQGVFLLNSVLTVEKGKANSHTNLGWETFTSTVLALINHYCEGVIFLLWGSYAKKRAAIINPERHHILNAAHPSPLSAHHGFFGCKHFSSANNLLKQKHQKQINWHLPNI
jgi:uracil-DNA glycosylase